MAEDSFLLRRHERNGIRFLPQDINQCGFTCGCASCVIKNTHKISICLFLVPDNHWQCLKCASDIERFTHSNGKFSITLRVQMN